MYMYVYAYKIIFCQFFQICVKFNKYNQVKYIRIDQKYKIANKNIKENKNILI